MRSTRTEEYEVRVSPGDQMLSLPVPPAAAARGAMLRVTIQFSVDG